MPIDVFRITSQVTFFNADLNGSNGADVVTHHHQIDQNLVIEDSLEFTINNPKLDEQHHVFYQINKWLYF